MLKPLGQRVLIKQKVKEVKSGLIVSDDLAEKLPRGTVVAIGDEVKNISIGSEVLFTGYAGERVEDDGEELLVVKLSEIIAVC